MKTGIMFGLLALSLSLNAWGKEPAGIKTDKQKLSYTAGYQIGQNLKRQNLDLDSKSFSQGVLDATSSLGRSGSIKASSSPLAERISGMNSRRARTIAPTSAISSRTDTSSKGSR